MAYPLILGRKSLCISPEVKSLSGINGLVPGSDALLAIKMHAFPGMLMVSFGLIARNSADMFKDAGIKHPLLEVQKSHALQSRASKHAEQHSLIDGLTSYMVDRMVEPNTVVEFCWTEHPRTRVPPSMIWGTQFSGEEH